jgi:hypothetical protein
VMCTESEVTFPFMSLNAGGIYVWYHVLLLCKMNWFSEIWCLIWAACKVGSVSDQHLSKLNSSGTWKWGLSVPDLIEIHLVVSDLNMQTERQL